MRGTTPAIAVAVVVLCGLVTGCGTTDSGSTGSERDLPVRTVGSEVLVSCGGEPGWVPSAMVDGIEGDTPRAEIAAALDDIAVQPKLSVETSRVLPEGGQTPWKLLAEDGDRLTVALGSWTADGPARDAVTMDLERTGDGWEWRGHGSCWQLAPMLEDTGTWVDVTADSVPTDTTEVTVEVTERACTGSRDPLPHLAEPVLVTTPEDVTVYWTSDPPEGAQECPGNPTVSQTLVLDEPLGDRPLLDGSRWPPAPIG